MKLTITLAQAIQILEKASALVIDDNALVYPSITDDDEDEFLRCDYTDSDFLTYEYTFMKSQNQEVVVVGCSLFMIDDTGEEVQVSILTTLKLEENGELIHGII